MRGRGLHPWGQELLLAFHQLTSWGPLDIRRSSAEVHVLT